MKHSQKSAAIDDPHQTRSLQRSNRHITHKNYISSENNHYRNHISSKESNEDRQPTVLNEGLGSPEPEIYRTLGKNERLRLSLDNGGIIYG
ncbi:hypothetical protein SUGI_0027220 [Cryptomeria japonica]|nr:hypothetical protein SUGI_0027220 [Cryptomeria japonica]